MGESIIQVRLYRYVQGHIPTAALTVVVLPAHTYAHTALHGDNATQHRFQRACVFDGELPHLSTNITALPVSTKRVVIGINVFDHEIGPKVAIAPVHSDAYKAEMANIQSFRRVLGDEEMNGDAGGGAPHFGALVLFVPPGDEGEGGWGGGVVYGDDDGAG